MWQLSSILRIEISWHIGCWEVIGQERNKLHCFCQSSIQRKTLDEIKSSSGPVPFFHG